jgi:hypothetical protein
MVARLIRYTGQKRALVSEFGTGKTASTHQVAAGLNCQAALEDRPCGICENCVFTYQRLAAYPSVLDRPSGGKKFWFLDTSRTEREVIQKLAEELTVYADPPGLIVLDEFQNAGEEIQQLLLKLVELKTSCTILVCFARLDAHHLTKALLQRLSPPLTPIKPTVEEFLPLIQRVLSQESIPLVDSGAPALLSKVCGRVPRLVLRVLEEVKAENEGLSCAIVESIATRLRIAGEGKEREK